MLLRKSRITTLTVLAVLAFSTFLPALAYAAPLDISDKNWVNPGETLGDSITAHRHRSPRITWIYWK